MSPTLTNPSDMTSWADPKEAMVPTLDPRGGGLLSPTMPDLSDMSSWPDPEGAMVPAKDVLQDMSFRTSTEAR